MYMFSKLGEFSGGSVYIQQQQHQISRILACKFQNTTVFTFYSSIYIYIYIYAQIVNNIWKKLSFFSVVIIILFEKKYIYWLININFPLKRNLLYRILEVPFFFFKIYKITLFLRISLILFLRLCLV